MKKYLLLLLLMFLVSFISAQKNVVDKIVAIVGDEIILKSDIENAFLQEQGRGVITSSSDFKTELLEQQLVQKLLMAQAAVDSITVSEDDVENALSGQIEHFINNIGSQERLEAYFGKSLQAIKDEMRNPMRERLITEEMQQKIVEKIRITPSEVRSYFKKILRSMFLSCVGNFARTCIISGKSQIPIVKRFMQIFQVPCRSVGSLFKVSSLIYPIIYRKTIYRASGTHKLPHSCSAGANMPLDYNRSL